MELKIMIIICTIICVQYMDNRMDGAADDTL